MKKRKSIILIASMICWVAIVAQQQEIVYGNLKTDGYYKTIKGAFWDSRPEAKAIYYGAYPDGIEVKVLETEYFIRFADGENNHLDINYIVFPRGEKIYKKDGQWFAAICGNLIDYWQPANLVKIVETEKKTSLDKTESSYLKPIDNKTKIPNGIGPVRSQNTKSRYSSKGSTVIVIEKTQPVVVYVSGGYYSPRYYGYYNQPSYYGGYNSPVYRSLGSNHYQSSCYSRSGSRSDYGGSNRSPASFSRGRR